MATQVRLPAGPLLNELDTGPDPVTFACVCRREELCPNTSSSVFPNQKRGIGSSVVLSGQTDPYPSTVMTRLSERST